MKQRYEHMQHITKRAAEAPVFREKDIMSPEKDGWELVAVNGNFYDTIVTYWKRPCRTASARTRSRSTTTSAASRAKRSASARAA